MKKLIALLLVFSIISLYGNLYAKERRGADLVIQKIDGQQVKGELITVKKDSLLLKDAGSGADVSVDISDISKITIVKKSKVWMGAGIGFGLGATGGALVGLLWEDTGDWTNAGLAFFFGTIAGAIGFLCGGIVGGIMGTDKTVQIEGRSEAEIKEILEELRKKARVSDFQ